MPDFMGQNARELCFVIRQGHQPARDIDITAGGREGIDDIGIQHRELELQVQSFRCFGQ